MAQMKWMIASDLHGSAKYCRLLLERMTQENADRLLLLGDLLYHGPRNDLPEEYAPKQVFAMLNGVADRLMCVRGNCDSEVDQMVLEFPILADYGVLTMEQRLIYATHGHVWSEETPPPMRPGDILLCGHTHVPKCASHGTFFYLNPGSVALPKDGSPHSYLVLEGTRFVWKDVVTGRAWQEWDANAE